MRLHENVYGYDHWYNLFLVRVALQHIRITPKFFYPHELQKNGAIIVEKVRSSDNLVDLFTKSLLAFTFEKYVIGIGMHRLGRLLSSGGATTSKQS